ncbi:hypothetical protein MHYP_G00116280 [Metynnis hypsauchen]
MARSVRSPAESVHVCQRASCLLQTEAVISSPAPSTGLTSEGCSLSTVIKTISFPLLSSAVTLGSFFSIEKCKWSLALSPVSVSLTQQIQSAAVPVQLVLRGDERGVGSHFVDVDIGGVQEDVVLAAEAGENGRDAGDKLGWAFAQVWGANTRTSRCS